MDGNPHSRLFLLLCRVINGVKEPQTKGEQQKLLRLEIHIIVVFQGLKGEITSCNSWAKQDPYRRGTHCTHHAVQNKGQQHVLASELRNGSS